jgi:hypothetical protein
MRRALAIAVAVLGLAASARAGVYVTGSGSVYQTTDSITPGWQAELGVGYTLTSFLAVEGTAGYANYYVEDAVRRRLRVDAVPVDASVIFFYSLPVVRPFLGLGPTWTWQHVGGRKNWSSYAGAHADVGVGISLGDLVSLTPQVGYRAYDWGNFRRGAWYYGVNIGLSFGR